MAAAAMSQGRRPGQVGEPAASERQAAGKICLSPAPAPVQLELGRAATGLERCCRPQSPPPPPLLELARMSTGPNSNRMLIEASASGLSSSSRAGPKIQSCIETPPPADLGAEFCRRLAIASGLPAAPPLGHADGSGDKSRARAARLRCARHTWRPAFCSLFIN